MKLRMRAEKTGGGSFSPLRPLFLARDQTGLALVTVILIVSLLAVVLVEFAYNTRIQLRMADSFSKQLKAYTIARGGIDSAADLLLYDSRKNQVDFFSKAMDSFDLAGGSLGEGVKLEEIWSWAAQGTPLSYPVGDGLLVIRISDESSKVNLNQLGDSNNRKVAIQLIQNLISTSTGLAQAPSAEVLVDSIREWTGGGLASDSGSQGMAEDYYQTLTPSYSSKDGLLDSISELRLIWGISTPLYAAFLEGAGPEAKNADALGSPLLTVFPQQSATARININTAPALVLESLHESFTPGLAQDVVESRQEKAFASTGEFLNEFVQDAHARLELQNLITVKSDVFSISSTGVVGDLAVTIKAVVMRIPTETRVVLLYYRVEG